MFKGKKILVTGGTGLIGRPLVEMLLEKGAQVRIVSLDDPARAHPEAEFLQLDLRSFENCVRATQGMEIVFQLAGIKGSPAMSARRPASFFVPTISFNTNMMEAARVSGAEKYLFTSSVGVYAPAEIFYEDDVWKTFPSPNDKFAGWAKRMGELQADAYRIEHEWSGISIVRPANVYGPFDNFDPANAMVIPSLIARALSGEDPFTVWGDGSPIRDFIHARDVARGMLLVMESGIQEPVNLGSGTGVSIRELAQVIAENLDHKPKIEWDISKPAGDKMRLMDMARAKSIGFTPEVSLAEGIRETIHWYREHKALAEKRYNVFQK